MKMFISQVRFARNKTLKMFLIFYVTIKRRESLIFEPLVRIKEVQSFCAPLFSLDGIIITDTIIKKDENVYLSG
jgi:hypothetical protein